jgi:hypothetical protein
MVGLLNLHMINDISVGKAPDYKFRGAELESQFDVLYFLPISLVWTTLGIADKSPVGGIRILMGISALRAKAFKVGGV